MPGKKATPAKVASKDDQSYFLRYLVALELFQLGLPQTEIGKRLRLQTAAVNQMLKGLNRRKENK